MASAGGSGRALQVYTDGGAEPNPGVGGWGAVVLDPRSGERRELSGGEPQTTNNRMELTAAIAALGAIEPGREIDLHTDSSYLRLGITRWLALWKRSGWRVRGGDPVKNEDLWRALEIAAAAHRVRWHWVKGHSGHVHNERAHELAAAAIRRQRGEQRAGAAIRAPTAGSRSAGDGARRGEGSAAAETARAGGSADAEVLLKLSCAGGRGAWAAQVRRGEDEHTLEGRASEVTSNRLELLAAAEILAALPADEVVEWRGGSDYLREGAGRWLDGWRRRGWRTSAGDPVKNADLWRRLDRLLAARRIRFLPAGDDDREAIAALERRIKDRLAGG